jgi:dTMP kinase
VTGTYVALEGIEGTGKSSIQRFLVSRLADRGNDVVAVREPGGTPASEAIREVLLSHDYRVDPWTEAMLMAAARSQLSAEVLGPAIEEGSWIVSDRSVYSSLAYQGGGRGLGVELVRTVNEAGLGGVWPEIVILLDLDPETGLERQRVPDRIGGAGLEFHRLVAETFRAIADAEPDRFVVIDASQPLASVQRQVVEVLGLK